jgi:flavin reductase (DIM6/NTAB) family NADH-FMN oxidoreductase RutF
MADAGHRAMGLGGLSPAAAYHLLTSVVLPRPVAWILSLNPDGSHNLAPFSFFNCVCADPPLLMVSIARRGGLPKDTARNLRERPDFTVNLPSRDQAAWVQASAADFPHGESEVAALGLAVTSSLHVSAPRLADAPVQLECRVERLLELGNGPVDLVLGRILEVHVRADALDERGRPLPEALDPLARLGGGRFAGLTPSFQVTP